MNQFWLWVAMRREQLFTKMLEFSAGQLAGILRFIQFGGSIMWPFGRYKVSERLNTVDLSDDLDDVEMLQEIEEAFRFEINDIEAQSLVSVGDLYELVKKKMPEDGSVDPVWELVVNIVRAYSGSRSPIDLETTFFPNCAKKRK